MNKKPLVDEQQLRDLLGSALREEPSWIVSSAVMKRVAVLQQRKEERRLEQRRHARMALSILGFLLVLLLGLLWAGSIGLLVPVNPSTGGYLDLNSWASPEIGPSTLVVSIGLSCLAGAVWLVGFMDRHQRFVRIP